MINFKRQIYTYPTLQSLHSQLDIFYHLEQNVLTYISTYQSIPIASLKNNVAIVGFLEKYIFIVGYFIMPIKRVF